MGIVKCITCGKSDCHAHGGEIVGHHDPKGVNREGAKKGESAMGKSVRRHDYEGAKKVAYSTIKEGRNVAGGKSHRPLEGLAEGGEVEDALDMPDGDMDQDLDSELMEMAAEELVSALEKKDKKGIVEAIKALVMSCKE